MKLGCSPPWVELVHHALAHLDVGDASSLYAPAYLAWCRAALPERAYEPLREDSAVLAALYRARAPRSWALSGLPVAFASPERFVEAIPRGDALLWDPRTFDDIAYGEAIRALAREEPSLVEVLVADLRLVLPAYAKAWETTVRPALEESCRAVHPWMERACEVAPALRDATVWLSSPLGVRGRAFTGGRLCVGAPLPWNDLPPEHSAVQCLHESAVLSSPGGGGHIESEARAWSRVATLVRGTALEDAHRAWQGRFDSRAIASE